MCFKVSRKVRGGFRLLLNRFSKDVEGVTGADDDAEEERLVEEDAVAGLTNDFPLLAFSVCWPQIASLFCFEPHESG